MDLSINIEERSYGGKIFRPNTVIYQEKASNLLLCITPWGASEITEKITDSIVNFVTLANEDSDLTVPYPRKETLHQKGNVLRMAVIMASEKINTAYNQDEYTTGFEIFAAIQDGPQWIYVSCGQPSVTLHRKNMGAINLNQSLDLNVLTQKKVLKDPLPNHLLGLGQHPPISFGNLRLQPGDSVALVSRTYLPNSFYQLSAEQFNQDEIASVLAKDSQDTPFWLGLLSID